MAGGTVKRRASFVGVGTSAEIDRRRRRWCAPLFRGALAWSDTESLRSALSYGPAADAPPSYRGMLPQCGECLTSCGSREGAGDGCVLSVRLGPGFRYPAMCK